MFREGDRITLEDAISYDDDDDCPLFVAVKCCRCGAVDSWKTGHVLIDVGLDYRTLPLCGACGRELEEWLNSKH